MDFAGMVLLIWFGYCAINLAIDFIFAAIWGRMIRGEKHLAAVA